MWMIRGSLRTPDRLLDYLTFVYSSQRSLGQWWVHIGQHNLGGSATMLQGPIFFTLEGRWGFLPESWVLARAWQASFAWVWWWGRRSSVAQCGDLWLALGLQWGQSCGFLWWLLGPVLWWIACGASWHRSRLLRLSGCTFSTQRPAYRVARRGLVGRWSCTSWWGCLLVLVGFLQGWSRSGGSSPGVERISWVFKQWALRRSGIGAVGLCGWYLGMCRWSKIQLQLYSKL